MTGDPRSAKNGGAGRKHQRINGGDGGGDDKRNKVNAGPGRDKENQQLNAANVTSAPVQLAMNGLVRLLLYTSLTTFVNSCISNKEQLRLQEANDIGVLRYNCVPTTTL